MTRTVNKTVETTVRIQGKSYLVTELTTDFNRYTETDLAEITVIPDGHDVRPSFNDRADLDINGRDVFQGVIRSVKDNEDGGFELRVMNSLYELKNSTVTLSITGNQPRLISKVVKMVCDAAEVDCNVDMDFWTAESVGPNDPFDYLIRIERTEANCAKVLDYLAKLANADWWVDNNDVVQFGLPDVSLHKLKADIDVSPANDIFIKETSAGKDTPPYRGVRVTGDRVVSQKGWEYAPILSRAPIVAERALFFDDSDGTWDVTKGKTNKPVFHYKSKELKSQGMADAVAQKLIQELQKQLQSGTVTVVGDERIDTMDIIEMPDEFGAAQYFVGKVSHTMGTNDGYVTKIHCEGLVPGRYN